jgi:hypothetical protein
MQASDPARDLPPEPRRTSPACYPARATVANWCSQSGMSRSATYRALSAGHLTAVKMGSRTLIDVPHGLAWLDSLPRATFSPVRRD